jgi:hypothetical protein
MKEANKQHIYTDIATSVIALIASLIGATISLNKLFDSGLARNFFQPFVQNKIWVEIVVTVILLVAVGALVAVPLFPKNLSKKDN